MKYLFNFVLVYFCLYSLSKKKGKKKKNTKERRWKKASQCSLLNLVSGDGKQLLLNVMGGKKSKQEPLMCAWPRQCTHFI